MLSALIQDKEKQWCWDVCIANTSGQCAHVCMCSTPYMYLDGSVCVSVCVDMTIEGRNGSSYLDGFMKSSWDMGCVLWRWHKDIVPLLIRLVGLETEKGFSFVCFNWVLKRLILSLDYYIFRSLFSSCSHSIEMRSYCAHIFFKLFVIRFHK